MNTKRVLIATICFVMLAWSAVAASAQGGGPALKALDTHRQDALEAIHSLYPLGPGQTFTGCPGPNRSLQGLNSNAPGSEQQYYDKILALLALHELGELGASAVEDARQLLRFQFCKWPGNGLGWENPPWRHGARTQAARIYLLYRDLLFPLAGQTNDPNADLVSLFDTRMLNGQFQDAYYGGTENHVAFVNSFRMLSHQVAGTTSGTAWNELVTFWNDYLSRSISQGMQEWGSSYQNWTWGAVLNLADFASDVSIRQKATVALDYMFALQAEQSTAGGYFSSASVRSYPSQILGNKHQIQSIWAQSLFTGGPITTRNGGLTSAFAASNYQPLQIVNSMYQSQPQNVAVRSKQQGRRWSQGNDHAAWYHHTYRGQTYSVSTNLTPRKNYYYPHDTVIAYVKSTKNPESHVVPIGYHPKTGNSSHRFETTRHSERGFAHDNVVIYTQGGVRPGCGSSTSDDCNPPQQPARLFATWDFAVQFQGGWAFLQNGVTWVAWRPTVGNPQIDNGVTYYPHQAGRYLRSSHTPDATGETCILEVADASKYASYGAFKSDVLTRNGSNPGVNSYTTHLGNTIQYVQGTSATYTNRVNGQAVALGTAYPRIDGPRLDGLTLTVGSQQANFTPAAGVSGDVARVTSGFVFGSGGTPDTEGPIVGLDTPVQHQVASSLIAVKGWALDESGVQSLVFRFAGQNISLQGYNYGDSRADVCADHGNVDPNCPQVGFHGVLDTRNFSNGPKIFRITATDTEGNTTIHEQVLTVDNASGRVPIITERFDELGACGRTAGGLLGGSCVETGASDLQWSSSNCEFADGRLTNRNVGTCWGNYPFTFKRSGIYSDPANYVAGLNRMAYRASVLFDRPDAGGSGATSLTLGLGRSSSLEDRILARLESDGDWVVLWEREVSAGGVLIASGTRANFDPQEWNSLQLEYDRTLNRVGLKVNGASLVTSAAVPGTPSIESAGFQVTVASGAESFLLDNVELTGDAVADGPYQGRYYLLKPASWSASRAIAEGLGATLATVNNSTENSNLFNHWSGFDINALDIAACGTLNGPACGTCDFGAPGIDGFWLGIHRPNGTWVWDGPGTGYRRWDSAFGQPTAQNQCPTGVFEPANYGVITNAAGTPGRWFSWREAASVTIMGIAEIN